MRRLIAAALALALAGGARAASFRPNEPVMPLSQVKAGMKGYGRTVFSGTEVKEFPVEVLGVVSKKDRPSKLVLIRASGPDIDAAGGLATGMSGTPVYVGGRLVGAFSFGWDFGDAKTGLVTPIEQMGALFDYKDDIPDRRGAPKKRSSPKTSLLDRKFNELYERRYGVPAAPDGGAGPAPGGSVPPLETDAATEERGGRMFVTADGISARAMSRLGRSLGVRVARGGSGENSAKPGAAPPVPGESISALLAWGDVTVDVGGTLTAVDARGRFVAFGHSFKNWGAVAYPVARASVYATVNSYESPFKLTSAGDIVGMITQDRPEGVAGYFGRYAPAVPVRLEVEDRDAGKTTVSRFQMIRSEHAVTALLPDLLSGLADRVLGRQSGGTARYDVTIGGDGMPDGWTVGDVVTSGDDVMSEAMAPVGEIVRAVVDNPYQSLGPLSVKVRVSVTRRTRKLLIEGLRVNKTEARPGETLEATVTLRPWREEPQTRTFTLRVPDDAAEGYRLTVRAGSPAPADDETRESSQMDRSLSSFEQFLREIRSSERGCEVVLELSSQDDAAPSPLEFPGETRRRRIREGSLRIFRSDYVVEGSLQVPLSVVPVKKTPGRAPEAVRSAS